jgi:hypothetical protein
VQVYVLLAPVFYGPICVNYLRGSHYSGGIEHGKNLYFMEFAFEAAIVLDQGHDTS